MQTPRSICRPGPHPKRCPHRSKDTGKADAITRLSARRYAHGPRCGHPLVIGRESVGSASGAASPMMIWRGRRVRGLGPGLTTESADAVSGCPANRSAGRGPGFPAPTGGAGLICPSCARGRDSQVRWPAGACHPSTCERDGCDHRRRRTRHYRRRGHPRRHARRRCARSHRGAARRPGVPGNRGWLRRPAGLAGRLRECVPGRDRRDGQLRRGPGPPCHRSRHPGRRGGPL